MAGFRDSTSDARRGWATLLLWLLLALLLAAFGLMAHGVYDHQGFSFDGPILTWFHQHVTPARTAVARALSRIGEPKPVAGVTALLVVALFVLRRWRDGVVIAIEVGGAAALDLVSKGIFARPRPTLFPHLVPESNFSFPSGHAMGDMAFYLALYLLLWRTLPRRWRWIGVLGLLLAVAIGVSRPYLQVHYPSDVLAGWAFGAGWVLGVHLLTSHRRKRRPMM